MVSGAAALLKAAAPWANGQQIRWGTGLEWGEVCVLACWLGMQCCS